MKARASREVYLLWTQGGKDLLVDPPLDQARYGERAEKKVGTQDPLSLETLGRVPVFHCTTTPTGDPRVDGLNDPPPTPSESVCLFVSEVDCELTKNLKRHQPVGEHMLSPAHQSIDTLSRIETHKPQYAANVHSSSTLTWRRFLISGFH